MTYIDSWLDAHPRAAGFLSIAACMACVLVVAYVEGA
jgi:hypothetical protein